MNNYYNCYNNWIFSVYDSEIVTYTYRSDAILKDGSLQV